MLNTLAEKVLSALLCLVLLLGTAVAVYAAFQHSAAQRAQIAQLQAQNDQERASTAAALQAASSLGAALDAKAAAVSSAAQAHAAANGRVAAAVAAAPSVASTVVPEAYWQAVYGGADAK
jgi:CBS domain containing-hemolysin-like protein